jgi:hypothetical protein
VESYTSFSTTGYLCDGRGNILQKGKNNNSVSMIHNNSTTPIGTLGGKIDAKVIIDNILSDNKEIAKMIGNLPGLFNEEAWIDRVYTNHIWDYKARGEDSPYGSTIFGVAWDYDQNANNGFNTAFISTFNTFNSAADFGNYNAGFTGIYANVPELLQFTLAGLGEVKKGHTGSDDFNNRSSKVRMREISTATAPYGDQYRDYMWNKTGMFDAKYNRSRF